MRPIPIEYFRIVSEIAPTSSAPPRLPTKSGEFTAKTPRPSPPTQRGKMVTQSGSYQEVLSGEIVKGEIGGKGVPTKPTGGAPPSSTSTSGAGGGQSTPPTSAPGKTTTPSRFEGRGGIVEPISVPEPVARIAAKGAALGAGMMMLNSKLFGNIQNSEAEKAAARLEVLTPEITRLLEEGNNVTVTIEVEVPTIFQFGVVSDVSQVVYYRDMYIKSG